MRGVAAARRATRQRVAVAATALVSLALLAVAIFGSRGLLHLRAIALEKGLLAERITTLLRENEKLRTRLDRLRTDDRHLERLAREQLGLVRPDEVVFRFRGRRAADPGAAPP